MTDPIKRCFGREPLNTSATAALAFLTAHAENGIAHFSLDEIGHGIRVEARTVTSALRALVDDGAIAYLPAKMKDGKRTGRFRIVDLPHCEEPEG